MDGGHGGLQAPTPTDYRLGAGGVDTPKLVKTGGLAGPKGTFSGALGGQPSVQLGRFQGWPVPLNGQPTDPLLVPFPR